VGKGGGKEAQHDEKPLKPGEVFLTVPVAAVSSRGESTIPAEVRRIGAAVIVGGFGKGGVGFAPPPADNGVFPRRPSKNLQNSCVCG